jgi:hypothetical protein
MAKAISFKVPKQANPLQTYDFPNGLSGGMNISVSPDQISPNQSPDMGDCNYDEGGVPSKRYGLTRVNALSWGTPIRGMYEFYKLGSDVPIFLIVHGGKLYSYDETNDVKTDLCTGSVLTFADADIPEEAWFTQGDKCFFLTGNEFLYYDGTNPVATVESIATIPLVAMGKSPNGSGGTPNQKFNRICNKWREAFVTDGTALEFTCDKQYIDDGVTLVTLSANPFKAYLYGVEKIEGVDFTFDRSTWKATFSTAPIAGTDKLEIELEATNYADPTLITHCKYAIEFAGKTDSHVLLTGNPEHPNTIYYNDVYDPTYWPEDSDFNVGGDSRDISGWGRLNEYLVTYKEPGDEYGQFYSTINIDSTTGAVSYETYGLNDEFGCIAPKTVHPAQGGLLALSDKGVVWTWPSLVKGQANCKVVSRNVNGRNGIAKGILDNTQVDLKNAHAEVYRNKYLLHVADTVWVLDLDYSDLANNVYCWYPYKGLYSSAGAFTSRSDRLYMSNKADGLLYKSQLSDDDFRFNDDGTAIDSWWTSPLMFLGGREWIKKFERISMTFKPTHGTRHTLSLISDMGVEDIPLLQASGFFDARYFHAEFLNAGTLNPDYPSTQSEKIGYKGEYVRIKLRNNMKDRGLTLLATNISYSLRKQVK